MEIIPGSDPSVPLNYDPSAVYNGEWVRNPDGLVGQAYTVLPGTTSDVTDPLSGIDPQPELLPPEPLPIVPGSDPSFPLDYDPDAIYNGEWVRFSDGLVGQALFTVLPGTTSNVIDPYKFPQPEPIPIFSENAALERFLSSFGF